ncbi:MAG: arginine deiminase family protein [Acidobacteriota bacterium]
MLPDLSGPALPAAVLVRGVASTMQRCLREGPHEALPIDVDRARDQHAGYVRAVRSLGIEVHELPADDACPDCCFIEDTAVVLGKAAVITRPGAASRRPEVVPVARVLERWCEIHRMQEPATLDGGDVLCAGRTLFVGISARTNSQGAEFLARIAEMEGTQTVTIPVEGALHLKSLCTLAGPRLLLHTRVLDPAPFLARGLGCRIVPDPQGANVLTLGQTVLVSASHPATSDMISRGLGLGTLAVDVSEFHKADGALTCLSIRIPAAGCWCA